MDAEKRELREKSQLAVDSRYLTALREREPETGRKPSNTRQVRASVFRKRRPYC